MGYFEYVMVLISIIIGLALTMIALSLLRPLNVPL